MHPSPTTRPTARVAHLRLLAAVVLGLAGCHRAQTVDPDIELPRIQLPQGRAGHVPPVVSGRAYQNLRTLPVRRQPVPPSDPTMGTLLARVSGFGVSARQLMDTREPFRAWQYIVLHHSATPSGSFTEFDQFHREKRGWDECGYHFVIGNGSGSGDGQIEVGSRWPTQKHGAHCKHPDHPEYNSHGIGICLVGNLEERRPTYRQVAATQALVALLRYWFKIREQRIRTHGQLVNRPGHTGTKCPGRHFPYATIVAR